MTPYDRHETVSQFLTNHTKDELVGIGLFLDADIKKSARKSVLVEQIGEYICNNAVKWLQRYPMRDLNILSKIVGRPKGRAYHHGAQPYQTLIEMFDILHAEYDDDDQVTFYLRDQLYDIIKASIGEAMAVMEQAYFPTFERYLLGTLNLYGVISAEELCQILSDATIRITNATSEDDMDVEKPLYFLSKSLLIDTGLISYEGKNYIAHPDIDDPYGLLEEIKTIDPQYKPLKKYSLEEIFNASDTSEFPILARNSREWKDLYRFLQSKGQSEQQCREGAYFLWRQGQDADSNVIMDVLSLLSPYDFKSEEEVTHYVELAIKYSNNTPRWCLRGRSPKELIIQSPPFDFSILPRSNKYKS